MFEMQGYERVLNKQQFTAPVVVWLLSLYSMLRQHWPMLLPMLLLLLWRAAGPL